MTITLAHIKATEERLKTISKEAGTESVSQLPSIGEIADLAADIWKIAERSKRDGAGDRVLAACERTLDRLGRMGIYLDSMIDRIYEPNMRAKVVDHKTGVGPLTVDHCISPAVYFREHLIREAEIVTVGGSE